MQCTSADCDEKGKSCVAVQNAGTAVLFAMPQSAACQQYLCTMASILVPNSTGPELSWHYFAGEAEVVQEASW